MKTLNYERVTIPCDVCGKLVSAMIDELAVADLVYPTYCVKHAFERGLIGEKEC